MGINLTAWFVLALTHRSQRYFRYPSGMFQVTSQINTGAISVSQMLCSIIWSKLKSCWGFFKYKPTTLLLSLKKYKPSNEAPASERLRRSVRSFEETVLNRQKPCNSITKYQRVWYLCFPKEAASCLKCLRQTLKTAHVNCIWVWLL